MPPPESSTTEPANPRLPSTLGLATAKPREGSHDWLLRAGAFVLPEQPPADSEEAGGHGFHGNDLRCYSWSDAATLPDPHSGPHRDARPSSPCSARGVIGLINPGCIVVATVTKHRAQRTAAKLNIKRSGHVGPLLTPVMFSVQSPATCSFSSSWPGKGARCWHARWRRLSNALRRVLSMKCHTPNTAFELCHAAKEEAYLCLFTAVTAQGQRTIYLGTDAGSVHTLTVRYRADAQRHTSDASADQFTALHEGSLRPDIYRAVRTEVTAPLCSTRSFFGSVMLAQRPCTRLHESCSVCTCRDSQYAVFMAPLNLLRCVLLRDIRAYDSRGSFLQDSLVRAITTCTDGSLLIFPEDGDGLVLQNPDHSPEEPDTGVSRFEELPVPWAQSLDPEHVPQAGGAHQSVRGAVHCADSAHDFAVAELKVLPLTMRRQAIWP